MQQSHLKQSRATGFSSSYSQTHKERRMGSEYQPCSISNEVQKQNIVPSKAQIQVLISALNQRKFNLKHVLITKHDHEAKSVDQNTHIEELSLKQEFESERGESIARETETIFQQIETARKLKSENKQKVLEVRKSLQSRYEQIMQMKRIIQNLNQEGSDKECNISELSEENSNLTRHSADLGLMIQSQGNEIMADKQALREGRVHQMTVQSAIQAIENRTKACVSEIKKQNKEFREMATAGKKVGDKIQRKRQEKHENQLYSCETKIKNQEIEQINFKLRSDLQKCQDHLQSVTKTNSLLENSIKEFSYTESRVIKLMQRHEVQKM